MACPYYILVSQSTLSNPTQASLSNTLRHPAIHYHYKDDSALALLPQHSDERVLIIDHAHDSQPTVHSISESVVVTGLKIEEAPGAAAATSPVDIDNKHDKMYIIETITNDDRPITSPHEERKSVQETLSQFKRTNEVLRRALLYSSNSQLSTSAISKPASEPVSPRSII